MINHKTDGVVPNFPVREEIRIQGRQHRTSSHFKIFGAIFSRSSCVVWRKRPGAVFTLYPLVRTPSNCLTSPAAVFLWPSGGEQFPPPHAKQIKPLQTKVVRCPWRVQWSSLLSGLFGDHRWTVKDHSPTSSQIRLQFQTKSTTSCYLILLTDWENLPLVCLTRKRGDTLLLFYPKKEISFLTPFKEWGTICRFELIMSSQFALFNSLALN